MKRALRNLLGGVIVLLLTSASVHAQAGATAQISGTVKDSSGGVLPGADVTAIQTDTGFKRSVITDSGGLYALVSLPIGPYRLDVTLTGFKSYSQTGIVLQVNSNPVIPVVLGLGQVEETVTVSGESPLIETRNLGVGQVMDNKEQRHQQEHGRRAGGSRLLGCRRAGLRRGVRPGRSDAQQPV